MTAARQAFLSITNSWSLLKLMPIELVLSLLRIRWPKYWSFSFNTPSKNTQDGYPLGWTVWISLQSKGLSRVFSNITVQKHLFFSHPYMTTGKTIVLTRQSFVGKVMFLLFKMLCRLVIAFIPRSKCLLISSLQSASAVILEPKKIKSVHFHCFLIYLP